VGSPTRRTQAGERRQQRDHWWNVRVTAAKGRYLGPYARLLLAVAALRDHDVAVARRNLAALAAAHVQPEHWKEERSSSRKRRRESTRRREGAGLARSVFESKCSPSSPLVDVTVSPILLPTVPDRKPRTECGNHPGAFIRSLEVAPPGRFSRSTILAVLLPGRASLGD
jgi:hypothetical protein